ncbi:hypothetical protein PTKIN_Ptkin03bG0193500 [Pterospermum kingtungense]
MGNNNDNSDFRGKKDIGSVAVHSQVRKIKKELEQRSAYRLLALEGLDPGIHDLPAGHSFWDKRWKFSVPAKVKIFVWRLMLGFLPAKLELQRRHFTSDSVCLRCGLAPETVSHALRGCGVARQIWDQAKFDWDKDYGVDESEAGRFLINAREIDLSQLQQFFYFGLGSVDWWKSGMPWWGPQKMMCTKLILMGAFRGRDWCGGVGVVIRNDMGEVMGAFSGPIKFASGPQLVEALATVTALEFVRDMGFQRIILEVDSVGIINQLSSTCQDLSDIGVVLAEGESSQTSLFHVHLHIRGGKVMLLLMHWHSLGLRNLIVNIWVEGSPPFSQDAVNADHLN